MKIQRSLTTKLMLIISAIMIMVAAAVLATNYTLLKKKQTLRFEQDLLTQINLTQSALTEAVFAYDFSQIEAISQSLVNTSIIASIKVYDHREKPLAAVADKEADPQFSVNKPDQIIVRGDKEIGKFTIIFSSKDMSALIAGQIQQSVVVVLTLLLSALATIFVVSKKLIVTPVTNLAGVILDIAEGGGDLTRRLPTDSGDEIALLCSNFNNVIEQIASIIGSVNAVTQQVSKNVNVMVKASSDTASSTDAQLHEIEMATAALTELAQSAQEVAAYASNAAQQTTNTANIAEQSARIVEESRATTASLSTQIDATTHKVAVLRDKSDSIDSVIEVIRSIAEQTNLLALNAAIEAARAGEQGRGFAVVADEVRSLAQKTQKSTQEVSTIIVQLQKAADEAHNSMHASKTSVDATVSTARQVSDKLDQIRANIEGIDTMNQQMANASKEQSITSNEVSKNVVNIYNLSHQVADNSKLVQKNSLELKHESSELEQQLSKFKL
ncbi:MAG: HAMP domain-containing methyl-accepting chemotaxis protein [Marinagarivorans sp.]|nr:HAMP domain-containing methyl-accepting chemotaxis protein [Marinagarivorans sp.]